MITFFEEKLLDDCPSYVHVALISGRVDSLDHDYARNLDNE
jgi:hypothetical protein